MSGRPLDVLEEAVSESVTVTLKGGDSVTGVLTGYDQHMNLVIETADEDITVIRGDNVVSIDL